MALQKFTLWMHKNIEGEYQAGKVWLAEVNLSGRDNFTHCVSLGQVVVEIDVPEIDTRQAEIEALQAQVQKERADSQMRVNLLQERIGKLLAIGHDSHSDIDVAIDADAKQ